MKKFTPLHFLFSGDTIGKYTLRAILLWSLLLTISLIWNIYTENQKIRLLAQKEAISIFNKDQAMRLWAASHGGVYVPVSERTKPSPNLSHLAERDIITPSGRRLTLMAPAMMLKDMMQQFDEKFHVKSHITSLYPLNPDNTPDEWETQAIKRFENGEKHVLEFQKIGGQNHIRLMKPYTVTSLCLNCHTSDHYKIRGIAGGASVSISMAPYEEMSRSTIQTMAITYVSIWIFGFLGINLFSYQTRKKMAEQHESAKALSDSEKRSRIILDSLYAGVLIIDKETHEIIDVNVHALTILNAKRSDIIGELCSKYLKKIDGTSCINDDETTTQTGFEYILTNQTGIDIPIMRTTSLITVLDSQYRIETFIDISEQKHAEEKYRIIVEGTDDIIFTLDKNLRFIAANNAIKKHLQLNPKTVEGTDFTEMFMDEGKQGLLNTGKEIFLQRIAEMKEKRKPFIMRLTLLSTKTKEPKELSIRFEPITIRSVDQVLAIASSIEDNVLLKYFVEEKQKYIIENYIAVADDMTYIMTRALHTYLDSREVNLIRLGLREIIINAIEHGNLAITYDEKTRAQTNNQYFELIRERQAHAEYAKRRVEIFYSINQDMAQYRITDEGKGFDHKKLALTDLSSLNETLITHGRGMAMAKDIFDTVTYNGKGNQVLLIKLLSGSQSSRL